MRIKMWRSRNKEAEEADKEEDDDNYQTTKCLTFLESQAQAQEDETNDINPIKPRNPI